MSVECVFLGYAPHYNDYRCLDSKTGRVYIRCDVQFHETYFLYPTLCLTLPQVSKVSVFDPKDILSLAFTSHEASTPLTIGQSSVLPFASTVPLPISVSVPTSTADYPLSPLGLPSLTRDVPSASSPSPVSVSSPTPPDPCAFSLISQGSSSHVSPYGHSTGSDLHVSPSLSPSVPAPTLSRASYTNVNPMQTRSKSSIVKPKCILSLSACLNEVEPATFKQAS